MALLASRGPRRVVLLLGVVMVVGLVVYRGFQIKETSHVTIPSYHDAATTSLNSYEKSLVIPHTTTEDISWIHSSFPPNNGTIYPVLYAVDSPRSPLPANKGHEAMTYLTHIINNYASLSPITLFMHPHRHSWHNNELSFHDAEDMITRLSPSYVLSEGYVNLRCHWNPGCPSWLHPSGVQDINKPEQPILSSIWPILFPDLPVPEVLAQPCCAQFAVSADRIRTLPRERYIALRKWLLETDLDDAISGRVFEYTWQVIFGAGMTRCLPEVQCYCKAYGICFEGEDGLAGWWDVWRRMRQMEDELEGLREGKWKGIRMGEGTARERIEVLEKEIAVRGVWLRAERWKAEIRSSAEGG